MIGRNEQTSLAIAALTCLAIALFSEGLAQPPPIPSDYSGYVLVGSELAPDGCLVFAKVEDYQSDSVSTLGGRYRYLIVSPPSVAYIWKTVEFWVDLDGNGPGLPVKAFETSTYSQGTSYPEFNLTVAAVPDTNPPSAPRDVRCISPQTDTTPTFTWSPATDNETAVARYKVAVPGKVAQTDVGNVTQWTSTELPEGNYTFQISAYDLANNAGPIAECNFTIKLADTIKPSITNPQPAPGTIVGQTAPEISCVASDAQSGINETSILMRLNGTKVTHSYDSVTGKICCMPTPLTQAAYLVEVYVEDLAGNNATLTWCFRIVLGDTQPPSKVTGLTVTDAKDGKLNIAWNPATDNVQVSHYKVYRDGTFLTNVPGVFYQDTGLTNGQTYAYQVSAVDTSNNEGAKSDPASGTPTKTVIPATLEERVAALESKVGILESTVSGIQGTLSSLQGIVSGLSSTLSTVNTKVSNLENKVTALAGSLGGIDSLVQGIKTDLGGLRANLTKAETRIVLLEAMDIQLDSTIQILRSEIQALEAKINETGAEAIEDLQKTVEALKTRMTTLETAQDTVKGEVQKLFAQQTDATTKIGNIETKLGQVEAEVTTLKTRMTTVEAKANTANTAATDALTKVNQIQQTVQGIQGTLGTLTETAESLKAKDSALETDIQAAKQAAQNALAEAANLVSSITAIQTDLAAVKTEVQSLKANVTSLDELSQKIKAVESKMSALESASAAITQRIASLEDSGKTLSSETSDLKARVESLEERKPSSGLAVVGIVIALVALLLAALPYLKARSS